VLNRTANALRTGPEEPPLLLGVAGAALGVSALCFLRPSRERVIADAAWSAGEAWRSRTFVVPALRDIEETAPHEAVGAAVSTLGISSPHEWVSVRTPGAASVLGVAGVVSAAGAARLAAVIDIVVTRGAAALDGRMKSLFAERARIASVVHEGVAQELSTVSVQLEVLSEMLRDTPQVQELTGLVRTTIRRAITNVREAIQDLTPAAPRTARAVGGMREFVSEFALRWALDVSFESADEPDVLDPDVVELAYAFVQEALTNMRKYSSSQRGAVRLGFDANGMKLTVTSEGDQRQRRRSGATGQGLKLMTSRARLLGGDVRSTARAAGGREVVLFVPI
jgi:signal transduction histidine kinase